MQLKGKTGILLSGGMDSMALAYWLKPDMAFTVDYGQTCAEAEIKSSEYLAKQMNMPHYVIHVDCSSLGSGSLIGKESLSISPAVEWWPFRNQLLVTLACMKGLGLGLSKLYVGSIRTDGDQHQDGTHEFYQLLSTAVSFQEGSIEVEAPAYNLTTDELILKSGIPLSWILHSHSCHTSNIPCMKCNGCNKSYGVRYRLGIG